MRGNASPGDWISEACFGRSSPLAQNGWVVGGSPRTYVCMCVCMYVEYVWGDVVLYGCAMCMYSTCRYSCMRVCTWGAVQSPYGHVPGHLSQPVVAFPFPSPVLSPICSISGGHKPQNSPARRFFWDELPLSRVSSLSTLDTLPQPPTLLKSPPSLKSDFFPTPPFRTFTTPEPLRV